LGAIQTDIFIHSFKGTNVNNLPKVVTLVANWPLNCEFGASTSRLLSHILPIYTILNRKTAIFDLQTKTINFHRSIALHENKNVECGLNNKFQGPQIKHGKSRQTTYDCLGTMAVCHMRQCMIVDRWFKTSISISCSTSCDKSFRQVRLPRSQSRSTGEEFRGKVSEHSSFLSRPCQQGLRGSSFRPPGIWLGQRDHRDSLLLSTRPHTHS